MSRMGRDLVWVIPSDVSEIGGIVDAILERCSRCPADPRKLRLNLRVGLTEALANAVVRGNGKDPAKRVRVEVHLGDAGIIARVTDEGLGFNPADVPDPTEGDRLHAHNGRGLFLMRRLLDEVSFNERGNSVTLKLRYETGPAPRGARA